MHTGEVSVSPYLPFGGDNCNLLKASGMTTPKKDWIWLPVSLDKQKQRQSLQWIREQSMDERCIESLATHDTDIRPHVIEL